MKVIFFLCGWVGVCVCVLEADEGRGQVITTG